jgi:hypothetical protein
VTLVEISSSALLSRLLVRFGRRELFTGGLGADTAAAKRAKK